MSTLVTPPTSPRIRWELLNVTVWLRLIGGQNRSKYSSVFVKLESTLSTILLLSLGQKGVTDQHHRFEYIFTLSAHLSESVKIADVALQKILKDESFQFSERGVCEIYESIVVEISNQKLTLKKSAGIVCILNTQFSSLSVIGLTEINWTIEMFI